METSAATSPADVGALPRSLTPSGSLALWALGGIVAVGVAVRFLDLGAQSYHHDEVITAGRVIGGSFGHMLSEVRASESNPPLYYVLAWGWAKWFGTGEAGLRSLSALFGAATIPVAYLIGRELAGRRAGLIAAALLAVNPMLIWYSQEARSYALLVLFGALSLLFFLRALRSGRGSDLALWSLFSALALCSHYFAFFPVAIEAAWLLLRSRGRLAGAIAAVGGVAAVGIALLPLLVAQSNPRHIGWIEGSPLGSRLVQSGVSFLIGETGHTIAEPPRPRYALVPLALVAIGMLILILRASGAEKREAARPLLVGLGVIALATAAALLGKDYVVERNLLPALVPLALVLAVAFGSSRARGLGLFCAGLLCAYWLAFDVYVDHTPNLQRPDFRTLTQRLGPPSRPRAIVTWRLAADPIRFYLDDGSIRIRHGAVAIREIDLITKPVASGRPLGLPAGFHPVARVRLDRLTLLRYMSRRPMIVPFDQLRDAPTGFGTNAVVADAPSPSAVPG